MTFPRDLRRRAAAVKIFVTDVDGVWTDGRILVNADGSETALFHIHDGLGVVRVIRSGIEVAVISGRASDPVEHRVRRLGVEEVHLGIADKGQCIGALIGARQLKPEQVAVIGDDLPDLEMFAAAGLCFAPPGAVEEVREQADWVTRAQGGSGCLREVCNLLLAAKAGASGS